MESSCSHGGGGDDDDDDYDDAEILDFRYGWIRGRRGAGGVLWLIVSLRVGRGRVHSEILSGG
jgi:hypothetical protein